MLLTGSCRSTQNPGLRMKKSQKENLTTAFRALLFIAFMGGILFLAIKFAPKDHFADNEILKDVADKYRY
jgi:hypothetical protein